MKTEERQIDLRLMMVEGARYKVRWIQQAGNGRWSLKEFVGVFLNDSGNVLFFSLRPAAGTSSIEKNHYVGARVTNEQPRSSKTIKQMKKDDALAFVAKYTPPGRRPS